jgi:hypothetical protein
VHAHEVGQSVVSTANAELSVTNSMEMVLLEELIVAQLLKKFPTLYGTCKSVTVFTRARHWFLSWVRWIQHVPSYHISLRSILTLSYHLRLGLPSDLFPWDFLAKMKMTLIIKRYIIRKASTKMPQLVKTGGKALPSQNNNNCVHFIHNNEELLLHLGMIITVSHLSICKWGLK